MSHETSSRAAAKIKAHKKRTNTQIHSKRINKINLVAFVQSTKKELFECLLPAFTYVRERQGLDHTIYPIGDWSVRALWEWQSTASGCRLGLGSVVTLRVYNAWFVPPSINNTTPRQLENKDPLLLQGPTSPCQNRPNPTNFGMLTTETFQERLIFPWILHSKSCSKLSRATGGDIPTGLSFAWLTC